MLSLMPFTPRYAIFYAIYPKLCYRLCHIPRSSAIFFLNVMLQYITLTPSYANLSYAMFSGQSRGHISGYCCITFWQGNSAKLRIVKKTFINFCLMNVMSTKNLFILLELRTKVLTYFLEFLMPAFLILLRCKKTVFLESPVFFRYQTSRMNRNRQMMH